MPNSETQIYFYYHIQYLKETLYRKTLPDSSMRKVQHCITVQGTHSAQCSQLRWRGGYRRLSISFRNEGKKLTAINETKVHNANNLKADTARQIELKRTN